MPRWKQNQNKDRYKEGGKSAEEIFGLASGAIGAVSGLASFGMGIDSMITARAKQAEAERQNKLLMEEAKRMSEKDFYAAAGVGRVGALAGERGEKTRIAMGDALYLNNKMKADSKQAVNQQGIDINVGAAQDQSQIARDANRQMNQSMTQAAEGLASGFQSAAGMIPGYLQGRTDSLTSDLIDQINSMELDGVSLNSKDQGDRDLFSNNDAFKKMKPKQIKDFIKQLKKNDPAAILNVKNIIKG